MTERECVFCKITRGEIESQILYCDDHVFVIRDIRPKAPIHLLIIPLHHRVGLSQAEPEQLSTLGQMSTLAQMCVVAAEMAQRQGVAQSGYRLVLNMRAGSGQVIDYVHMYLLGGRPLSAIG